MAVEREYRVTVSQEFFRDHYVTAANAKEARAKVDDLIHGRGEDDAIGVSVDSGEVGPERIRGVKRIVWGESQ